jgi:hypothetical protein
MSICDGSFGSTGGPGLALPTYEYVLFYFCDELLTHCSAQIVVMKARAQKTMTKSSACRHGVDRRIWTNNSRSKRPWIQLSYFSLRQRYSFFSLLLLLLLLHVVVVVVVFVVVLVELVVVVVVVVVFVVVLVELVVVVIVIVVVIVLLLLLLLYFF